MEKKVYFYRQVNFHKVHSKNCFSNFIISFAIINLYRNGRNGIIFKEGKNSKINSLYEKKRK